MAGSTVNVAFLLIVSVLALPCVSLRCYGGLATKTGKNGGAFVSAKCPVFKYAANHAPPTNARPFSEQCVRITTQPQYFGQSLTQTVITRGCDSVLSRYCQYYNVSSKGSSFSCTQMTRRYPSSFDFNATLCCCSKDNCNSARSSVPAFPVAFLVLCSAMGLLSGKMPSSLGFILSSVILLADSTLALKCYSGVSTAPDASKSVFLSGTSCPVPINNQTHPLQGAGYCVRIAAGQSYTSKGLTPTVVKGCELSLGVRCPAAGCFYNVRIASSLFLVPVFFGRLSPGDKNLSK